MFRLLAANVWFMEKFEPFREIIKNKIIEFEADINTKEVAREFIWLKEYPYPEPEQCGRRKYGITVSRVSAQRIKNETMQQSDEEKSVLADWEFC